MNSHDKKVAAYLQAERELMRRYEEIKYGKFMSDVQTSEMFAPLLTPLQEINSKVHDNANQSQNTDLETSASQQESKTKQTTGAKKKKFPGKIDKFDPIFGLYLKGDNLYVGNQTAEFVGDLLVLGNGRKYQWTQGLCQLLTENDPRSYSSQDLENYHQIILDSFAYKLDNDPHKFGLKYNSSKKYKTIITPFIEKHKLLDNRKATRSGRGLTKELTTNTVEYVHWNKLDELLERLYILYGEIKAGNTNPSIRNEITSILEEIKEEKNESRLHF